MNCCTNFSATWCNTVLIPGMGALRFESYLAHHISKSKDDFEMFSRSLLMIFQWSFDAIGAEVTTSKCVALKDPTRPLYDPP